MIPLALGMRLALALAWAALASPASVTCDFTVDNYVHSLYIDDVDVTSSISGTLNDWTSKKSITFKDSALLLALEGSDGGCIHQCTIVVSNVIGSRSSVLCTPLACCSFCALAWLMFGVALGRKASRSAACTLLLMLSGPVGFVPMVEAAALVNAGGTPTSASAPVPVANHAPPLGRAMAHTWSTASKAPFANVVMIDTQAPSSKTGTNQQTGVLERHPADAPSSDTPSPSSRVTHRLEQINLSPGDNRQTPVGFVRMAGAAALENAGGAPTFASESFDANALALVTSSRVARRLAVVHQVLPGAGTLQTALDEANAGDTLELADGTYTRTHAVSGSNNNMLEISKDVTIRAQNSGQAVLDGGNAGISAEQSGRVVYITGGTVLLEGLEITNGYSTFRAGGGVYVQGATATFDRCNIHDNHVFHSRGGGMYITGSSAQVTVTNSEINGNTAIEANGGGIHVNDNGIINITNSAINQNRAHYGGGMFCSSSLVHVTNSHISGNSNSTDTSQGGGLYIYSGTVNIRSSNIGQNSATLGGGITVGGLAAFFATSIRLAVDIQDSDINQNHASLWAGGGGLAVFEGTVVILNSNINQNHGGSGVGIYAGGGTIRIRNSNFNENIASIGCADTCVDVAGVDRTSNGVCDDIGSNVPCAYGTDCADCGPREGGGAIFGLASAHLYLTSTTFDANTAPISGSAIYWRSSGDSLLTSCTFRNHASADHASADMVRQESPLKWFCAPGQWTPWTGSIPALDFTGCAYDCPEGTIGTSPNLTSADKCDACPTGHYCGRTGLSEGTPCPAGMRMPAVGARSVEACLRRRLAIEFETPHPPTWLALTAPYVRSRLWTSLRPRPLQQPAGPGDVLVVCCRVLHSGGQRHRVLR